MGLSIPEPSNVWVYPEALPSESPVLPGNSGHVLASVESPRSSPKAQGLPRALFFSLSFLPR